jgi:DNA mismatch repair ATPase MutL
MRIITSAILEGESTILETLLSLFMPLWLRYSRDCEQTLKQYSKSVWYYSARKHVTIQPFIKTVMYVMARSVFCDEAVPRRSICLINGRLLRQKRLAMTWLSGYENTTF